MLYIDNVTHSYNGKQDAVSGISFEVGNETITGLIGFNGAGKTTLIKSIVGLLKPDEGQIIINGHPASSIKAKSATAYLPEKFNIPHSISGKEYISFTLAFYDVPYLEINVLDMASKLFLRENALDEPVSSYSKGMVQKLGLITTFLTEAKLLVLDEPMSGLDPNARIALKAELKKYAELGTGRSVLLSSHIMADVESICEEIAVIHNGVMQYKGNIDSFKSQHASDDLEHAILAMAQKQAA